MNTIDASLLLMRYLPIIMTAYGSKPDIDTPSGEEAKYGKYFPSGESNGLARWAARKQFAKANRDSKRRSPTSNHIR